jgi:hypothetical protein
LLKHITDSHIGCLNSDLGKSKFDNAAFAIDVMREVHDNLYFPALKEVVITYPHEVGYMPIETRYQQERKRTSSVCVAFRKGGDYFNCATLYPCDSNYLVSAKPFSFELSTNEEVTIEAYRLSDKHVPIHCSSFIDLELPAYVSATNVFPAEYIRRH